MLRISFFNNKVEYREIKDVSELFYNSISFLFRLSKLFL